MSSEAGGAGPGIHRVDDSSADDRLLLRNADDDATVLTVVRRRDEYVTTDTVRAAPRTTYSVTVPRGTGSTLVEVHCRETTATTSIHPDERPPMFSYRDGTLTVARD